MKLDRIKPILLILPYDSCSGMELFGVRFAEDMIKRGFPCIIASPDKGKIHHQCAIHGVAHYPLPAFSRFSLVGFSLLKRCLSETKPQLIIGFRTQAAHAVHLARILLRMHVPLILFYRIGAGNQRRFDPFHQRLFRRIAAVIPNADHVKNKILSKWAIDAEKVVCIKSGVSVDKYRPDAERRMELRDKIGISKDAFVIGSTGRLHPEKGSQILLEALWGENGAAKDLQNIHLVYVGNEYKPGYADFLKSTAKRLGVADHFHIMPFQDRVEKVYPAFNLFVLAVTSHETYAYVALEAMACGVIPIIPHTGGMKEMLKDGIEGFFFTHRDSSSLCETLKKALQLPRNILEKMGQAARTRIQTRASWNDMMNQYIELIARL